MAMIAPRMSSRGSNIRAVTRQISAISRQLHNFSRMYNRTYRMVFELKEKEHLFYVESASGEWQPKTRKALLEEVKSDKNKNDKDSKEKQSPFNMDPQLTKKPIVLPKGLWVKNIEFGGSTNESVSTGKIYIYYSAQGAVDEAIIHLTDKEKINWSIAIHPLTGFATVIGQDISLREIQQE